MSSNSKNDGPKRCKCKKSKCLKLYCECFAAGFFCDENCSCKDCFNTPDYEDTVHEAREQIKLRYPNAFSPKIHMPTETETNHNEDGDVAKSSGGKHIKGCNCKKSKCKKNYCECYQAKVGCSDECRCEGCQNDFGKREGYDVYRRSLPVNNQFNGCHTPPGSATDVTYPNAAFMNQFTPETTPQSNARRLFTSVPGLGLPPLMDWPNSSTSANANFSPVNTVQWPGSQVNQAHLMFGTQSDSYVTSPCDYNYNVYKKAIHDTTKNPMQFMGSEFALPFQHFGHENNPPPSARYIPSLDSAHCNITDMMLGQQCYPGFEFMNRFASPLMGGPDSSGWTGSQVTPGTMSNGPKLTTPIKGPVLAGSVTSPGDK